MNKISHTKNACNLFQKSNFGGFFGIRASIRIGREIHCPPYAGFFILILKVLTSRSLMNSFIVLSILEAVAQNQRKKDIYAKPSIYS